MRRRHDRPIGRSQSWWQYYHGINKQLYDGVEGELADHLRARAGSFFQSIRVLGTDLPGGQALSDLTAAPISLWST